MMEHEAKALKLLGQNIRKLRRDMGLSQEEFAHRADIDRSYIGQIERGERNIAFVNTLKIARALGVKVSYLTDGIE
ncbi:MAG: helix-turn-helix domain-containing protein [Rhodobacterales bacterium]